MSLFRRRFMNSGIYEYSAEFQLTYDPNTYGEEKYHTNAVYTGSGSSTYDYTDTPGIGFAICPSEPYVQDANYNIYFNGGVCNRQKDIFIDVEIHEVNTNEKITKTVKIPAVLEPPVMGTLPTKIYFFFKLIHDETITTGLKDIVFQNCATSYAESPFKNSHIVAPMDYGYNTKNPVEASTTQEEYVLGATMNLLKGGYRGEYNIKVTLKAFEKFKDNNFDFYNIGYTDYSESEKNVKPGKETATCDCFTKFGEKSSVFGIDRLM